MYVSKYFKIQELVSKDVYNSRGEFAWELLDLELILTLDELREILNRPITVNDWHIGGRYKDSGFRLPSFYTSMSFSQHLYGRAADIKVKGLTALQVQDFIIEAKRSNKLPHLRGLELDTPTWTHIDTRYTDRGGENELFLFRP